MAFCQLIKGAANEQVHQLIKYRSTLENAKLMLPEPNNMCLFRLPVFSTRPVEN